MSVVSFSFLLFIFISFIIYYIVPGRVQWIWLLLISGIFFVYTSGWLLIVVLLAYIGVNWFSAMMFSRLDDQKKKALFIFTLFLDIFGLYFFKYKNFVSTTLNGIVGVLGYEAVLPSYDIVAPIGMSFFVLSIIGYLADSYWGLVEPQKNLAKLALFTGYFPILTSGPILRYSEMRDSLFCMHKFDGQKIKFGIQRIVWGFFKKLVISERLAVIVNTVYGDYTTYNGLYIIIAMSCFSLQLFTDFSGCMDVVVGTSEIFGIRLPENFDTPFFSTNISEFWRKWHITLGAWLKNYVFYPVLRSGLWNRIKKASRAKFGKQVSMSITTYMGLFVSWFLIGLWHDGSWNMIIGVGLWFWFLIVMSEMCQPLFKRLLAFFHIHTECFSWRLYQRLRTFILFTIGLSFFRAQSLLDGLKLWRAVFAEQNIWILFDGSIYELGIDRKDFGVLIFSLLLLLVVSIMHRKMGVREWISSQNLLFRWIIYSLFVISIVIFGYYGSEYNAAYFIYQGF